MSRSLPGPGTFTPADHCTGARRVRGTEEEDAGWLVMLVPRGKGKLKYDQGIDGGERQEGISADSRKERMDNRESWP